jgi:deoxyribonuclease (pyrimidine dimer)
MTRVNLVPVSELCNQHLLAEHREIKRIPNAILSGIARLDGNYGSRYVLGTGHVKFFYNKLDWLAERYTLVYQECLIRGFNVQNYYESFMDAIVKTYYFQKPWTPSSDEVDISRQRINTKLENMKIKTWS